MGNVVLISTYEMGRQPFGLASPAAWLADAGADVTLQDLAVSHFDPEPVRHADLVGIYVPMHTATRLAEGVIKRVRELNPAAHVCAYGLYAPVNEERLTELGADSVVGGEFEQALVDLHDTLALGGDKTTGTGVPRVVLERQSFKVPDRSGLPPLATYAHLELAPGVDRVVGYTEATRGCKHLCRHCPVVPVYGGKFVVVQPDVVIADVARQVAAGAEHVTFGDPDFFNGPAHAMRIVSRLHREYPSLTYDVTIKVEHIVRHADLLGDLKATGCVLVTSAVESFDPVILDKLDKRHSEHDVGTALAALRADGLPLNATFVAFTPWTTREGYLTLLDRIAATGLVESVQPIQYAIRLLIPSGSRLLELPDVSDMVDPFDPKELSHPWRHPDPAVDLLQKRVLAIVERSAHGERMRADVFRDVWRVATEAAGSAATPPALPDVTDPVTVPFMTEPWFC